MSDTLAKGPANPTSPKKPRQGRSPAFPWIPIQKALERAEVFRVAEGGRPKHFSPTASACTAWGLGPKTGPALQTIAAMGHYGLFEFEGSGENRAVRLTDLALNILLDKQPVSAERDVLIAQAALKPTIHAELWQKWQATLPSDPTLETFLVRDKSFSETGAKDLIAEYKETIKFAKLWQSGIIPYIDSSLDEVVDPPKAEVKVGDLVQVAINGVLQLPQPTRVRAVQDHEGSQWVFVEGSEAGIPMEQVIVEQKGAIVPKGDVKPPILVLPPDAPSAKGTRREVFALDEGDVVLTFPENLSAASFYDLDGHLQLFLRKAQRRAGAGDYFAEVYAPDGIKAKEVQYFDSFPPLLLFIQAFKARNSNDILRIHLPARASNEERETATKVSGRLVL